MYDDVKILLFMDPFKSLKVISSFDYKMRVFWGFPLSTNIRSNMLELVLMCIDFLKNGQLPIYFFIIIIICHVIILWL